MDEKQMEERINFLTEVLGNLNSYIVDAFKEIEKKDLELLKAEEKKEEGKQSKEIDDLKQELKEMKDLLKEQSSTNKGVIDKVVDGVDAGIEAVNEAMSPPAPPEEESKPLKVIKPKKRIPFGF